MESVLAVDNKKVQDLIENRVISEQEIKKAKITIDIWYTYAERTSKYNKICFDNSLLIRETIGIKKLVITDLSRMKENKICIFGVDEEKKYIRPVIPTSGITERYIFDEKGNQIIKPFAEVEFDFIRPLPEPPHTEDWEINASYKPRLIRDLSENDIKRFLEEILDDSVKAMFGPTIYYNRHIKIGGNRSIGTIKVKKVHSVNYSIKESDKYNYRITFSDMSGEVYNLPITDYAFRKYCDSQRLQKGETTDFIRHKLQQIFNQSDLFLRVGLSRRYKDAYWLLISGLYTFPDYRKQDYGME